jgi:superfamily II DNA or RNA helicase
MLIRTSGIIIPKDYENIEIIKSHLDKNIKTFTGAMIQIQYYEDLPNGDVLIPRNYPIGDMVIDKCEDGADIDIESHIVPKNERQQNAIDFLTMSNSGILKLEPGSGKTVVAIATISKLKKKTIIFVHKDKLRRQWKEEILTFTNLKDEDIPFLTRKHYKKQLDKPIIISTVQGFSSFLKTVPGFKECVDSANIGIAFFDEAHATVGSKKFSNCSLHIPIKRVFGLSATPYRDDGTTDILNYHLGEIRYFLPEVGELMAPVVYMIYFPFGVYSAHKKYLSYGGQFSYGKYYQQLYKSELYLKRIAHYTKQLYDKDRNILLLGIRIKPFIEMLRLLEIPKDEIGFFIPSVEKKQKGKKSIKEEISEFIDYNGLDDAFKNRRIVLSTYNACRDGNNRKTLDTLIMTTPTKNIEQAIGRILRELSDKKCPYVLDIVDTDGPLVYSKDLGYKVSIFDRMAVKRKLFYQEKKWEVKEFRFEG